MPKRRSIEWPKRPPPLTPEQEAAREAFMRAWHEVLPTRYGIVERFNHGALARLPPGRSRWRTLEIGAGIGGHLPFEDLDRQEYHCLERRDEFCTVLAEQPGVAGVHALDIEAPTPFDAGSFDRIVAIHVLEHLRNLPRALDEISRILADDGIFDVVLPCEGGLAYYVARRISAKPFFERRFGMSYDPIIASEHVSTLAEVLQTLEPHFVAQSVAHFPLGIPIDTINLAVALRMVKRRAGAKSA
jgi:SAM-dependent methyltransferase